MELAKAVSLGYKVHRIFETWTWTTWKDDLFVEYIKEFLKIKQEASGWPRSNMTDEEKDAYLQECEDKMGVRLDREKVIYNPGLRHLAKLALNSFWGKWGQRGNLVSTQFVSTAEEIWSIIRDDRKGMKLPIAIFTTSQARLHLYQYLEELQEKVVYYDTDSVIYCATSEENNRLLVRHKGDLLGQLKDETGGVRIVKFVAAAPKAYSYVLENGKTENYDVRSLALVCGSNTYPAQRYLIDYERDHFVQPYVQFLEALNFAGRRKGNGISMEQYKNGWCLYCFEIGVPADEDSFEVLRSGTTALKIEFAKALPEDVTAIVYSEFQNILYLDQTRNTVSDSNA
ncbi:hypothetical protein QR680_008108 [Steinernema hermaphroditum]|uniref:DNA-directed DNA polymerase n=1 Tax=Steinernema hermaphroditum TaxID=289476 RepID=A0AA39IFE0_9BILA|nr:hypothetical protein QR680_008108 [Steinernema hermaphroditum]